MKKFLALLVVLITSFTFIACDPASSDGKDEIAFNLGVVDGAPALAVANVINGYDFEGEEYSVKTGVELSANAQTITASLISGDLDMAIIPLNLASKLYNESKNLDIKLATVNIFGCLYMIGKTDVASVEDLKGKIVYTVGQNGTPEIIFNFLLSQSGVEYEYGDEVVDSNKVYVKVASQASEIIQAINGGLADYAILGEPAVTNICAKTGSHVVLDLQAEWKKHHPEGKFVQAGLVVKGNVAEKTEYLDALIQKLMQNEEYLTANVSSLKDIYTQKESASLKLDFTLEILERCNVGCSRASVEKANIVAFLTAVKNFKAPLVGGELPQDDFYL
ncbi:MAG: ABC transporter substrate-binding protein [Clostridia bacterium]|nr:ABC transporter substrate-binding protein [Clostridia bacterium]